MVQILIAAIALLGGHHRPPTAAATLTTLEAKAKVEHKNVLVIFHASWCGWCHKLDNFMNSPQFKEKFANSYEIFHVDVMESDPKKKSLETPGGGKLLSQAKADQAGLPYFLVYSPSGEVLMTSKNGANNIGYPGSPEEISYFATFLTKTAPKMSQDEIASISTYLKAQKN